MTCAALVKNRTAVPNDWLASRPLSSDGFSFQSFSIFPSILPMGMLAFKDAFLKNLRNVALMNALAYEVDQTLRSVDKGTATRLERLVRDALDLVNPHTPEKHELQNRQEWLQRLDALRGSVGTGKRGTSTEEILDDLRSDRCL